MNSPQIRSIIQELEKRVKLMSDDCFKIKIEKLDPPEVLVDQEGFLSRCEMHKKGYPLEAVLEIESLQKENKLLRDELKKEREVVDVFGSTTNQYKYSARRAYGENGCKNFVWEFNDPSIKWARQRIKERKDT